MDHRLLEVIRLGIHLYSVRIQPRPDKPFPYLPGARAVVSTKRGRIILTGFLMSNPYEDEQLLITGISRRVVKAGQGIYVDVEPVRSNFVLRPVSDYRRNFLFFAEKEGILPIASMISAVLKIEQRSRCRVVWTLPEGAEFFENQLGLWEAMVHGRLEVVKPEHHNDLKIWLNSYLSVPGDFPDRIYICGSELFVNTLISRLVNAGMPTSLINYLIL